MKRPIAVSWAYGVMTCPGRKTDLLPRTLHSLKLAGFDQPRLFVDGDTTADGRWWMEKFDLEVTVRGGDPVWTYGHWVLSIGELFLRNPQATRFALFQDDFITLKNLKSYLTKCPMPERGYWNLYTFPQNQQLAEGRTGWYPSNQKGLGAVALVFSREGLLRLLTNDNMTERPLDAHKQNSWKSVDGAIVTTMKRIGYTEYVHNPSLVQHMGFRSTIANRTHLQALSFPGVDVDAEKLA